MKIEISHHSTMLPRSSLAGSATWKHQHPDENAEFEKAVAEELGGIPKNAPCCGGCRHFWSGVHQGKWIERSQCLKAHIYVGSYMLCPSYEAEEVTP